MSEILDRADLGARVTDAIKSGMMHAVWAEVQPDARAVIESATGKVRTWSELNANANRVARLLMESGLRPGDAVALVCTNRLEFCDVLSGVMRVGMRVTPVNWHLTAEEIAYVVQDCEAKALFGDVKVPPILEAAEQCAGLKVKVAIGGDLPGFLPYDATLARIDGSNIPNPLRGYTMLYTSGTTGRPKGVFKPNAAAPVFSDAYDRERDMHLCTGPAYHAAPLMGDVRRSLTNGVPTVLLEKWDSEEVLRLIERYRVTNCHMVAIMFQRLLALPEAVRGKYDLSSLRTVTHGAAPCPPEVKRAMIEWLGPIINEYYAGSEGGAGFRLDSHEWLRKPGSVGRRPGAASAKILDDEGNECPVGVAGTIYMKLPETGAFQYYNDPAKTDKGRRGDYFTLGDIGYLDEDDYLFLTGRNAETIISGGVNIYPQEVDNELIKHPAVEDSCTVGVPNEEWGEEVRAVIQLKAGWEASDVLKDEILGHAHRGLARFKVPRGLDFVAELPRSAAGKVLRNRVREPYWAGRSRQI